MYIRHSRKMMGEVRQGGTEAEECGPGALRSREI